jgi:peptide/nickel transport system permease protein
VTKAGVLRQPDDNEGPDVSGRTLGRPFWIAIGWLGLLTVLAVLASWLPIEDPNKVGAGGPRLGPSFSHFFGTDALGRDVFARTIFGARISLLVGFLAIVFGIVVGGGLGIIAGYFRGITDQVISFCFFTLLSFPALVLALLITATIDRNQWTVSFTLGILAVASVGRLSRANTIVFAEREFVQAARVLGANSRRIITHELLPNVMIPMGALALLGMGIAIVAEGSLAFLGLSVEGDAVSWGKSIVDGSQARDLDKNPNVALFPIGVMFLTVLALNYAGDRVREYFDVRETAF